MLDQNTISSFTRLELASIIFCHRRGFCANVNENNVDNRTINSIYSQFLKSGCKITGLTGNFGGTECGNLELKI
jgi:hypothetical protein